MDCSTTDGGLRLEAAPDCIVRDRDCAYGGYSFGGFARWAFVTTNCTAIARQNAYAERLIGSIRQEVVDHVVVLGDVTFATYCYRT
jgi:hypothetical protein